MPRGKKSKNSNKSSNVSDSNNNSDLTDPPINNDLDLENANDVHPNNSEKRVNQINLTRTDENFDNSDQIVKDIAIKLSIFDGDDYLRWSRECKRVLVLFNLDKFIETDYSEGTSDEILLDMKCAAYLDAHISNKIKNELNRVNESAYSIWEALKIWYGHRDTIELDKIYKDLKFLRIENDDIEKYKEVFLKILKTIKKFDVEIDNSFLVFCYFDGLGERGRRYKELYKDNSDLEPLDLCLEVTRLYGRSNYRKQIDVVQINKTFGNQNKVNNNQDHRRNNNHFNSKNNFRNYQQFNRSSFDPRKLPFYKQKNAMANIKENKPDESDDNNKKVINFGTNNKKNDCCWKCGKEGHIFKNCNESRGLNVIVNVVKDQVSDKWIFDTGAAVHVTNNLKWYTSYIDCETVFGTSDITGKLESKAIGEVCLILKCGSVLKIPNVYYCPKASVNLITNVNLDPKIRFLIDAKVGYIWLDEGNEDEYVEFCVVNNNQNVINLKENDKVNVTTRSGKSTQPKSIIVDPKNNIERSVESDNNSMEVESIEDSRMHDLTRRYFDRKQVFKNIYELHEVYGHPGIVRMLLLAKEYNFSMNNFNCELCNKLNLTLKHSIEPSQRWTTQANDLVHIDLCEPYPSLSAYDGANYIVTIVDDFTGYIQVYTVRDKEADTVFRIFNSYRIYAERWHDSKIKVVRSDFGKEFDNQRFKSELSELGIRHEFGVPHVHYQLGKVERANRTIQRGMEKILEDSQINTWYWPEAAKTTAYLYNRQIGYRKVPPHILWNKRYDARKLFKFGSRIYYNNPAPVRKGFKDNKEAIFMGYDRQTTMYRVLDLDSNKITTQQFITYK